MSPLVPLLDEHYQGDPAIIYKHACELGCERIVEVARIAVSLRPRRPLTQNQKPSFAGVKREAEEEWK